MSSPWILVSPCSRGLGQAVARRLLRATNLPVLATARTADTAAVKADLLDAPGCDVEEHGPRLHVVRADVTDEASLEAAAVRAAELFPPETHHLHVALALAGVLHPEKSPARVDAAAARETFAVNALGPLLLMKWFERFLLPRRRSPSSSSSSSSSPSGASFSSSSSPASSSSTPQTTTASSDPEADPAGTLPTLTLPRHATWLTASARVGSTTDNRLGGWYSYRASKAAVNSLTRTFDLHLAARSSSSPSSSSSSRRDETEEGEGRGEGGAMAVAYHPGTVRTGLSREFWDRVPTGQLFSADFAAERLLEVLASRTLKQRGRCWDWKGEEVPP
ncbi:short-chain dehydrogenase/reductase-like protein [Xylariaceae sp. FL0804]|nr:short-chain dehydrogenase/reductase-like protein [Xylariaceae sp. FL0804]